MTDHTEVDKLKRQLDAIYKVNCFSASITDQQKLLSLILEESKRIVNCEASSLMLYDREKDELYFEVVLGDKSDIVKEVRLKMGQGIAGQVARSHEIINVKDVRTGNLHFKRVDELSHFETISLLALPLLRGDKLIGVIEVLNKRPNPDSPEVDNYFNDEDIKIMTILAEQAAISIENAQLLAESIKREKLVAIGRTVAGTAHYIKNILTGLSGAIDIMDIGINKNNWDIIDKSWPIFKRSNQKISKLVNDMLAYSKDREPVKSPHSLKELIEDCCERVHDKAKQTNVNVINEFCGDGIIVNIEASAIGSAIHNILNNAIDACDKDDNMVHVIAGENGDKVVISIADNGCGIPPNILERIFDPFFSTKGSNGTGLGLAIARKVIEEHNGSLTVESVPGRGSSFTILLPVSPSASPPFPINPTDTPPRK